MPTKQRRLTRKAVCELAALYDGLRVYQHGGYNTGTYCQFVGRLRPGAKLTERVMSGRIVGHLGFCSEAIFIMREEARSRGGTAHGLELYFARERAQLAKFKRWVDYAYARTGS